MKEYLKSLGSVFLIIVVLCGSAAWADQSQTPLWRGDGSRKVIALTFDDGPKPEFSYKLLDILDRYGVKATFFVVGEEAREHPDIIFRMDDSLHEVANHSHSSVSGKKLSKEEFLRQIKLTSEIIYEIIGKYPKHFRPPGGWYDTGIRKALARLGLRIVNWTVNAEDYVEDSLEFEVNEDWDQQAKELIPKVVNKVENGAIVLFHNGSPPTVRSLPYIIEELKEKGYSFVTISELTRSL